MWWPYFFFTLIFLPRVSGAGTDNDINWEEEDKSFSWEEGWCMQQLDHLQTDIRYTSPRYLVAEFPLTEHHMSYRHFCEIIWRSLAIHEDYYFQHLVCLFHGRLNGLCKTIAREEFGLAGKPPTDACYPFTCVDVHSALQTGRGRQTLAKYVQQLQLYQHTSATCGKKSCFPPLALTSDLKNQPIITSPPSATITNTSPPSTLDDVAVTAGYTQGSSATSSTTTVSRSITTTTPTKSSTPQVRNTISFGDFKSILLSSSTSSKRPHVKINDPYKRIPTPTVPLFSKTSFTVINSLRAKTAQETIFPLPTTPPSVFRDATQVVDDLTSESLSSPLKTDKPPVQQASRGSPGPRYNVLIGVCVTLLVVTCLIIAIILIRKRSSPGPGSNLGSSAVLYTSLEDKAQREV